MRVEADSLQTPASPQAQGTLPGLGVYCFAYEDSEKPGTHIQERLCVDQQAGVFEWRRFSHQKREEVDLGDGGAWATSMVCSVRFTTKWGDPSREFLLATQPQLVRRREMFKSLTRFAATLKRIATLLLNPLSLSLILSCALTAELWRTFPTSASGTYNMSEAANESAMVSSIVLSVVALLLAIAAGWWLGVFRFACFRKDRVLWGIVTRLPTTTTQRFGLQRTVNMGVLSAFLACCLFSLVLCSVALSLNAQEECVPYASPSVVLASSASRTVSGALDPCYSIEGVPLVCGIGACSCSAVRELSCEAPPSPPATVCRRVPRPLCAGDGAAVDPSGLHGWLIAGAVLSAAVSCALGLCWLANTGVLLVMGSGTAVVAQAATVQYHKFEVSFRSGKEKPLVVILDAKEDPFAVFGSLMPGPSMQRPPGTPAKLAATAGISSTLFRGVGGQVAIAEDAKQQQQPQQPQQQLSSAGPKRTPTVDRLRMLAAPQQRQGPAVQAAAQQAAPAQKEDEDVEPQWC